MTDGTVNATLPKGTLPDELTMERAVELLAEKAAKGPAPKKPRGGRKTGGKPTRRAKKG